MLIGGAIVNGLAFSGSSYLFSKLRSSDAEEERKRHDKALEQLQTAQAEWSRKRSERLDWINNELQRQRHAERTFQDVDAAIREYNRYVGKATLEPFEKEPTLADFYQPSDRQKDREIAFIILGMAATGLVAYQLAK